MIRIVNLDEIDARMLLTRGAEETRSVDDVVRGIIDDVRARGDAALREYTKRFDGADIPNVRVTPGELDEAVASVSPELLDILRQARENIEEYHLRQKRNDYLLRAEKGALLGQLVLPVDGAGLYVPGGTAAYPSSVLMNAIPARIAGVKRIVMATPPGRDGRVNPAILAAARIAGVTDIVKCGGAQAIAAMAYGTESVPRVCKITGPGNIFVATAKRMVSGIVGIDMIAGPSEICVIASADANPRWVTADMLGQAEHDKLAMAVLLTDSETLARAVQSEIERQMPLLPREEIARHSVDSYGRIVLCPSVDAAIEAANDIAPEHLEICVPEPMRYLASVRNAGSVFLGHYAPEALGDYLAGTNHVLPTNGTARFSSPLSVDDFVKKTCFTYYTREALSLVKEQIARFAETEGLHAHAQSVTVRFEEVEKP